MAIEKHGLIVELSPKSIERQTLSKYRVCRGFRDGTNSVPPHRRSRGGVALLLVIGLPACANEVRRPTGWSEATHGLGVSPDYELLFASDVVHSLEIAIGSSDYEEMQANLTALLNDSPIGRQRGLGPPGDAGAFPNLPPGDAGIPGGGFAGPGANPEGNGAPPNDPSGGPVNLLSEDPMYVPVQVRHEGHAWTRVGMRYKGNSSLAASGGSGKLPFRLDFDEYEDQFPEIKNQRFYGFDELTFASNWNDDSQLRECFATELLRDRAVPAARCAFYRVFIDVGDGLEYWGLYSMLEDPSDNAMLDSQLGGEGGNLYKPEGPGADWVSFDSDGFIKKTNEATGDWSDVEKAVAALHADRSNPSAWREKLEATFDVGRFIQWLAINTSMVNWDTYGSIAHNYYLYGSPAVDGRLQWIPWDHNLSLQSGGFGRGRPGATQAAQSARAEMFHEGVGAEWPLISILLADPVYAQGYRDQLERAIEGLFDEEPASARLRTLHDLIAPYVVGPDGEVSTHTTISSPAGFIDSVDGANGLLTHLATRRTLVREALAEE